MEKSFLKLSRKIGNFEWNQTKGTFCKGRSGGKGNATSSKAHSASQSPPVTLEQEDLNSTAYPASILPPPTPLTETSTELDLELPKGTPPQPIPPQALHRRPPLPQLTPPTS
ncbi:hypothetical protein AWC38_SpisGene24173 [Stylophora pistillata]|uniref:Uncharacterized protein n=1 Tax=Stylophora pistillata TaxID=50429 RepID=A0A2B4R6P0_STYPI|nr:hypothetical protein AWC38_SpisGene24173 [Stylophora pistillata]